MRPLTTIAAGVCAVAVIAAGALAGCGASQPGASERAKTLARVDCGSAATRFLDGSTRLLSADPGARRCFDAAVTHCQAATITVTTMGVDAGTRYVFVIEAGTHPCQVTEQRQFYLVSGGPHHGPVTTVTCQRAAATASAVTLTCGSQQLLIPASVSHSEVAG
jgi:hypothetical protein